MRISNCSFKKKYWFAVSGHWHSHAAVSKVNAAASLSCIWARLRRCLRSINLSFKPWATLAWLNCCCLRTCSCSTRKRCFNSLIRPKICSELGNGANGSLNNETLLGESDSSAVARRPLELDLLRGMFVMPVGMPLTPTPPPPFNPWLCRIPNGMRVGSGVRLDGSLRSDGESNSRANCSSAVDSSSSLSTPLSVNGIEDYSEKCMRFQIDHTLINKIFIFQPNWLTSQIIPGAVLWLWTCAHFLDPCLDQTNSFIAQFAGSRFAIFVD